MNRESIKEARDIKEVVLGREAALEELAAVARFGAKVFFSEEYKERVNKCRALVDQFVKEQRRMYGITTGLGENVKRAIPEESAIRYQKNTLLTHCTSVGEPMEENRARNAF
ncbi:MAG: aromatic amino acid lyase [Cloacibacillus evryensis]